jgi:hypothetical protein
VPVGRVFFPVGAAGFVVGVLWRCGFVACLASRVAWVIRSLLSIASYLGDGVAYSSRFFQSEPGPLVGLTVKLMFRIRSELRGKHNFGL